MKHLLFLIFFCPSLLFAQLTLRVSSFPSNTPAADDIYVAGTMNTWDPGNVDYKLTLDGGSYWITFTPPLGAMSYKFTRGSWPKVEGNEAGGFLPDRNYNYMGGVDTVEISILSWEDLGSSSGNTTAANNVQIYSTNFWMPQLNKSRRIWVYLPPDYETSTKDYPVLYMQDGQNVFDLYTSFAGEWEVDETLNDLFNNQGDYGCIVVAIDNGGADRLDEYSPWLNTNYNAGGEGAAYVDFIVQTLKPNIDSMFRTMPEREHTGIMGSSLGALISHYAGVKYQDVFSKVGDLSSAFWFNSEIYNYTTTAGKQENMRFYLLVGGNEEANDEVVTQTQQMDFALMNAGFDTWERNYQFREYGTHSESFWRNEFAEAYIWLFGEEAVSANDKPTDFGRIYPNPSQTFVQLDVPLDSGTLTIRDLNGRIVLTKPLTSTKISVDTTNWASGAYNVQLQNASGRTVYSSSLLVNH